LPALGLPLAVAFGRFGLDVDFGACEVCFGAGADVVRSGAEVDGRADGLVDVFDDGVLDPLDDGVDPGAGPASPGPAPDPMI